MTITYIIQGTTPDGQTVYKGAVNNRTVLLMAEGSKAPDRLTHYADFDLAILQARRLVTRGVLSKASVKAYHPDVIFPLLSEVAKIDPEAEWADTL